MNIQKLTSGRIVHFFHNGSTREDARLAAKSGAAFLPAIITSVSDATTGSMHVFTEGAPCFTAYSIVHKSKVEDGLPYWDYPQREAEQEAEKPAPVKASPMAADPVPKPAPAKGSKK